MANLSPHVSPAHASTNKVAQGGHRLQGHGYSACAWLGVCNGRAQAVGDPGEAYPAAWFLVGLPGLWVWKGQEISIEVCDL